MCCVAREVVNHKKVDGGKVGDGSEVGGGDMGYQIIKFYRCARS